MINIMRFFSRKKVKIGRIIILRIFINMVNCFIRCKITFKDRFCNESMFCYITTPISIWMIRFIKPNITKIINFSTFYVISPVTFMRTKLFSGSNISNKRFFAHMTFSCFSFNPVRMLSSHILTFARFGHSFYMFWRMFLTFVMSAMMKGNHFAYFGRTFCTNHTNSITFARASTAFCFASLYKKFITYWTHIFFDHTNMITDDKILVK